VKTLITGTTGQLGRALLAAAPPDVQVVPADRSVLDITDADAVTAFVAREEPALVINAAAWTAVDLAEQAPTEAFVANRDGPGHLARALRGSDARLIHVSTDYVFDGTASTPRRLEDVPKPLSVYGLSKLAGERVVRATLGARSLIVRTAWMYDAHGNNFVNTMLKQMRDGRSLRVVADQIGSPTSARSLAQAIWVASAAEPFEGIAHCTDAGVASWYDVAVAIQQEALALGLLQAPVAITPIRTIDYPTLAARPPCSVLDCTETWSRLALTPVHWRDALRATLEEMPLG
jgi:dTDP-4-dehydrorhamnose reductase